jgi:hypothetical protein
MRSSRPFSCLVIATVFAFAIQAAVRGEDFRVDSKVFVGKETAPHSTNITLFQGMHVYDFLDTPRQITVYDIKSVRIVLLDPVEQKKCEVSRAMIDAFCDSLVHMAKKTRDPLLEFALRPDFEERDEQDERIFSSKYITYRVKLLAAQLDGQATRYRAFSDASARLNALVNRGSLPPFPRMAIDESLAKSGHVPARLQVTISPRRLFGGTTVVLHSEHEFRARLLDSDLRKIEEAGELLAGASQVGLVEYLRPTSAD